MRLVMVLAGFVLATVWGWSKLNRDGGKGTEKALYTVIVAISAYIAAAGLLSWPIWSPVRLFRAPFVPFGRWLEWALIGA
ncbi:hypothetical protein [Cohnella fermenti]|uniref:Uncharacterized protein n=1 Tax=Cohnella fermenti TaxID=2565925 RepID=A0A4S4BSQ8_9BACL|nr:hypothetical protein [Cohnella fermenti]THF78048.1 hypothetical protein E6C55_15240 [Cohnella fermenti]